MVEQPLLFSGCSSIQFSNSFLVTYRIAPEVFTLISYNFMTQGTPCCTMLSFSFPTQLILGKQRISLGYQVFEPCTCTHIANLLPTNWCYLVGSIYVLGAATDYYNNQLLLDLNSLCQHGGMIEKEIILFFSF